MTDELTIRVYEIVGTPLCVASDDGQKVHDQIAGALRNGRRVIISFHNVESLTSAFLNAAIGQLYGSFKEENIREQVCVEDMESDDLALLKRVVETAKEYFRDPKRFKDATSEVLGDDSE